MNIHSLKKIIGKVLAQPAFGSFVVVLGLVATSRADAFDSLTEASIQQKVGSVIKLMASIFGSIGIVFCLFRAGWAHFQDEHADLISWIKRAAIGALLTLGCWGIGQLLITVMK